MSLIITNYYNSKVNLRYIRYNFDPEKIMWCCRDLFEFIKINNIILIKYLKKDTRFDFNFMNLIKLYLLNKRKTKILSFLLINYEIPKKIIIYNTSKISRYFLKNCIKFNIKIDTQNIDISYKYHNRLKEYNGKFYIRYNDDIFKEIQNKKDARKIFNIAIKNDNEQIIFKIDKKFLSKHMLLDAYAYNKLNICSYLKDNGIISNDKKISEYLTRYNNLDELKKNSNISLKCFNIAHSKKYNEILLYLVSIDKIKYSEGKMMKYICGIEEKENREEIIPHNFIYDKITARRIQLRMYYDKRSEINVKAVFKYTNISKSELYIYCNRFITLEDRYKYNIYI